MTELKLNHFNLDDDDDIFTAFDAGKYHSGSACPLFTREMWEKAEKRFGLEHNKVVFMDGKAVVFLINDTSARLTADDLARIAEERFAELNREAYLTEDLGHGIGSLTLIEGETHDIDGKETTLYAIGGGDWAWVESIQQKHKGDYVEFVIEHPDGTADVLMDVFDGKNGILMREAVARFESVEAADAFVAKPREDRNDTAPGL